MKKCPQCKSIMKNVKFDVGYGLHIPSFHCSLCGFNTTDPQVLKKSLFKLKEHLKKDVKVIRVGAGLGIRFPNEIVRSYNLKKGEEVVIQPEEKGIRLVKS